MKEINHECYVDLEVANLLKEAGFDWECEYAYIPSTEMGNVPFKHLHNRTNYNGLQYEVYSAPTLDVAQRWLREVKRYFVEVNYDDCQKHYWVELFINEDDGGGIPFYGNVFAMFEEAQESGIKKALELILEKGE